MVRNLHVLVTVAPLMVIDRVPQPVELSQLLLNRCILIGMRLRTFLLVLLMLVLQPFDPSEMLLNCLIFFKINPLVACMYKLHLLNFNEVFLDRRIFVTMYFEVVC